MKKFTLKDFNKFKRNSSGLLKCPSRNYSVIESFPYKCSFED